MSRCSPDMEASATSSSMSLLSVGAIYRKWWSLRGHNRKSRKWKHHRFCNSAVQCKEIKRKEIYFCCCSILSPSLCPCPVSSDAWGRVPASGPVWTGRGLRDGRRSALPGVAPHHLPRNQSQESLLWPFSALPHERAVWNCGHPRRHRGDHW